MPRNYLPLQILMSQEDRYYFPRLAEELRDALEGQPLEEAERTTAATFWTWALDWETVVYGELLRSAANFNGSDGFHHHLEGLLGERRRVAEAYRGAWDEGHLALSFAQGGDQQCSLSHNSPFATRTWDAWFGARSVAVSRYFNGVDEFLMETDEAEAAKITFLIGLIAGTMGAYEFRLLVSLYSEWVLRCKKLESQRDSDIIHASWFRDHLKNLISQWNSAYAPILLDHYRVGFDLMAQPEHLCDPFSLLSHL